MPDIFLSYTRDDQAIARRFAEGLEAEGFKVWWDQTLDPGEAYDEVTEKALESASAVIVLWSRTSVASRWVRAEATTADRLGTLVPVMIEPCKRPIMFELRQSADLSGWKGDRQDARWRAFVDSLRRVAGRGQSGPAAIASPIPASRVRTPALIWGALAVVVVAAGVGAYWLLQREPKPATPVTAEQVRTTIAVMPFVNLTNDPEKEYFGDGIADELIKGFGSRVPGLRVAARSSSFSFKGKNEDVRQIAEKLGVDAVLEGSVQSAGDTIRLTAQLADGRTGFQLWSEGYERPFTDIFKLQDEITREIVSQVRRHFGVDVADPAAAKRPTNDVEAYRLYLQALEAQALGDKESLERSIVLLEQATDRDPSFAMAYAARAVPQWLIYLRGYSGSQDLLRSAERDIDRALQLDPQLAEAHMGRAFALANQGEWIQARRSLDRAAESGMQSDFLRGTGFGITAMGHLDWTRRIVHGVDRRHVADASTALGLATQEFVLGETEASREHAELAATLGFGPTVPPLPMLLAMIDLRESRYEEASDRFVAGLSPGFRALGAEPVVRQVNAAFVNPGGRAAASTALRNLVEHAGEADLIQMETVMVLIWQTRLGALDAAYDWAGRLAEGYGSSRAGRGILYWIWIDEMQPFRQDPRFQEFTEELGLLEYWREYGPPDKCKFESGKLVCN